MSQCVALGFIIWLDGQVHVEELVHERQHPVGVDIALNQHRGEVVSQAI
jgi:hypothetical protein